MIDMDFYVYDNIMTYNKLQPFNGLPNTRVEILGIEIPESGAFWFHTEMQQTESNVNLYKRYVHWHPGIGTTNTLRSNDKIHQVKKENMKWNPENKCIEIRNSILPWKKPLFMKKVKFHGSDVPKKKVAILGMCFYNLSTNSIHFVLDYYSQDKKLKFHWEIDENEPATMEQIIKVEMLEEEIAEKEKLLKEEQIRERQKSHLTNL